MRGCMLAEVDMERLMLSFNQIFGKPDELADCEQGTQNTLEVKNEYQESIQSGKETTQCKRS